MSEGEGVGKSVKKISSEGSSHNSVLDSGATVVSSQISVDIIASVVIPPATVELGFSQNVTATVLLVLESPAFSVDEMMDMVGVEVGSDVGFGVGLLVGSSLGFDIGPIVGSLVGKGVGAGFWRPQ